MRNNIHIVPQAFAKKPNIRYKSTINSGIGSNAANAFLLFALQAVLIDYFRFEIRIS